ncbi:SpoIIAA-like [Palleronia salina]|uniref:SpoIIAA-like n=1 Tax=Palleronia salina TaxID=313368 RepID=A0A1M6DGD0_9RHOB|nr:STAS/SEC14 domain-containing protein [Palleronia salina]SHI72245.1 SpoIIAA-like [Palleronia salina]
MLTVKKTAPNRIEIDLSGEIDSETMREGLDKLIALSQDMNRAQLLYRINAFALPTLGAMAVEFARLPQLFGLLGRFDRCAVLSDAAWLRTAAEVEGALFPGLDIKSFRADDDAAAEAWLDGTAN